jgi:Electron transfer DM13
MPQAQNVNIERWSALFDATFKGELTMFGKAKTGIALALLISFTGTEHASAQETAQAVEAGAFHGKVHKTSGRATIYKQADGQLILRLTNFKTSNGPDVHVVLIAAKDAEDDTNFLKSNTEKLELGALKGNEGDQNYTIPAGTDLDRFQTVSIYCERFNANFGAASLNKL